MNPHDLGPITVLTHDTREIRGCQEQLAMLVQRFRLKQQLQRVLAEEKRRQRVILSAIAHQLLVSLAQMAADGSTG